MVQLGRVEIGNEQRSGEQERRKRYENDKEQAKMELRLSAL
jgi:hypothetical protein